MISVERKIEKIKKKEKETTGLAKKELEILVLLYKFRFLNRLHIQKMLRHKYHGQIQIWLNNLVEKDCLTKDYEKKFAGSAAIYHLTPSSRKYLKDQPHVKPQLLDRRVWREKDRTKEFKDHCLFLADTHISLQGFTDKANSTLYYFAKTDLWGRDYVLEPKPDAYFAIFTERGNVKRYFLDLFDEIPPRAMRARVNQYLKYYEDDTWYEKYPDKPFPAIIFICPHKRIKGHLYHYIQDQLCYPELEFYLTTKEIIRKKGLVRESLDKVKDEI